LAAGQTATTCYTEKKAAFEDDKTAKESLEDELEQEYIAMKKIQCYLRVWLETEDVTDIDKTISQKCDATDIVTEPVELVYPAIPDSYVIDTNPVSIYPGEVGFETQYYTEPTLTYHDVTPCASTAAATQSNQQITCPSGYTEIEGDCYSQPRSAYDHRSSGGPDDNCRGVENLCQSEGATLMTRSQAETWLRVDGNTVGKTYGLTSTRNGVKHWFTNYGPGWYQGCCSHDNRWFVCVSSMD
jgi:hypothetical protein